MRRRSGTIRNVLAVVSGLAGALLVMAIGSFVVIRSTYSPEELARIRESTPGSPEFETAMAQISSPFVKVQRAARASMLIICPTAAVAAGLIVGGIASARPAALAALTGLLSSGALLAATGFSIRSFVLGAISATLAGLSGWQIERWRAR